MTEPEQVWEEPGGGVRVTLKRRRTIVVYDGSVTAADVVVDERGGGRPRRIRPNKVAVRYDNDGDGWTMVLTLGGPSVRANGRPGDDYHYIEFHPGGARPPFWAGLFAVDQHPAPETLDADGAEAMRDAQQLIADVADGRRREPEEPQ
jgi:hypothetical protein